MIFIAVCPHKMLQGWAKAPSLRGYTVTELSEALLATYDTDAHLVMYVAGPAGTMQPRLTKGSYDVCGIPATVSVLFADVDNPGHRKWHVGELESIRDVARTEGLYATEHGYRLIQPLAEPLPIPEVEGALRAWHRALLDRGIAGLDTKCSDWTRHFRLPNTRKSKGGTIFRSGLVDLSRMSPVRIEPIAKPKTERRKPTRARAVPASFAGSVPSAWAGLVDGLSRATFVMGGERHEFSLVLAGALAQQHVLLEAVPAIVRDVAARTGSADPHHHERNARDTVEKIGRGESIAGIQRLRERWPTVATALEQWGEDEPATGPVTLSIAHDGVALLQSSCGMGKTRALEDLAVQQSSKTTRLGRKIGISVDKHELAVQIAANLRARGVAVKRLYGPLSVDGCKHRDVAEPLVRGGQSLKRIFCGNETAPKCDAFATCTVRLGFEGTHDAAVIVGPHQLLSSIDAETGSTSPLIIDEPPSLIETEHLQPADLELVERSLGDFEPDYGRYVRHLVAELRAYLGGTDVSWSSLRALVRSDETPPIVDHAIAKARTSVEYARALGAASKTCDRLLRAMRCGGIRLAGEGLSVSFTNSRLAATLPREGTVVVMSAEAELHAPLYARLLGYEPPVRRFAAGDGAPIERTLFRVGASRKKFTGDPASLEAAVRHVLAWANGRSLGIVTFRQWRKRVEKLVGDRAAVGHYGAMKGLDKWRDFDCVATIGDPRPSPEAVRSEAEYAGVDPDERADAIAKAELAQAHGRLRTIHRTKPGWACHFGEIVPGGFGWKRAEVVDLTAGGGREKAIGTADELRAEIATSSVAAVARRLGVSRTTLYARVSG